MKATKGNMRDHILTDDKNILHCPECGTEYSGNAGDYWYLADSFVFTCADCQVEMELVEKIVTIQFK